VKELADHELLAVAHRTPGAFGLFYGRHAAAVLAYMARRVREPEVAADLTAEVFAAALEDAPRFDPARGSAVAWLYGIAHHKLVDAVRAGQVEDRARRRLGVGALHVGDDDLERVRELASLDGAALGAALAQLPAAERAAVQARIVEERPYDEIAGEVATSALVVRKRVSRGLTRLRTILGETR
jgi:RNA polymerase sigma-70 factor (ECF subfamily)